MCGQSELQPPNEQLEPSTDPCSGGQAKPRSTVPVWCVVSLSSSPLTSSSNRALTPAVAVKQSLGTRCLFGQSELQPRNKRRIFNTNVNGLFNRQTNPFLVQLEPYSTHTTGHAWYVMPCNVTGWLV